MNRDTLIRRAIGALGTAQAALYQLQAVPTWPRRVSYSCFMQMVVSELAPLCAEPYEKQRTAKAIVTRLVQDFGVGVETERPAYGIDDHER